MTTTNRFDRTSSLELIDLADELAEAIASPAPGFDVEDTKREIAEIRSELARRA